VRHYTRLLHIAHLLSQADNARELRRYLGEAVPEYMAVNWAMAKHLEEAARERGGWSELVHDIHGELFQMLNTGATDIFLAVDRRILLDVLKQNTRLVDLLTKVPAENARALNSALMDGIAALQKLDLIITTIALIASKEVAIENTRVLHWLCLAARWYLREFQSALFANNPVLRNRLSHESRTISNEEMEHRLGLSG